MERIKLLTDEQLVAKLKEYGESAGPLTSSTRFIFEKRLLKHLCPPANDNNGSGKQPSPADDLSSTTNGPQNTNQTANSAQDWEKKKSLVFSEPLNQEPDVYFGVQLPMEVKDKDTSCVFTDKTEALRFMKKYPGSRFKPFDRRDKAERFSKRIPESFPPPSPAKPPTQTGPTSPIVFRQPISEGSEFRSVKTQDLVKLRKFIEAGDIQSAKHLIWLNPRYLINSGDTPTILQEGFRYNALHVSAMKNQPNSAQLILDTVQDPEFMRRLYPTEPLESRNNRIQFLLDLYLNTPDKGNCECALHFACKFGHVEVVDVLASHPQIDKYRKNKYGETPSDMICARSKVSVAGVKEKIKELLEDRFFVPLLRSDDNSCPPHVSTPWSPTVDGEKEWQSTGTAGSPVRNGNVGALPGSPRDSPVSVKAYAGPMSCVQAKRFRKNWLTPPSVSPKERKEMADVRRRDSEKGMERIGRNVAHAMGIPWVEYWDFLECYANLTTASGLTKLEDCLQGQYDSMKKQNELEDDLLAVSDQLNQLRPSESSPKTGSSADNAFGFGKLVLYLEKDSDLLGKEDERASGVHEEKTNQENALGADNAANANHENSAPNERDTKASGQDNPQRVSNLLSNTDNMAATGECPDNAVSSQSPTDQTRDGNTSYDQSLLHDFNMNSDLHSYRQKRDPDLSSNDEDTDSEGSDDSFHTAMDVDESDAESLFTPPQSISPTPQEASMSYFIYGSNPNKIDLDVLRALEWMDIDGDTYPRVYEWKKNVLAYRDEERNRWGTPKHIRTAQHGMASTPVRQPLGTPYRANNTPSAFGSPGFSYRSPSISFSSPGSVSDSDHSFDRSTDIRSNLMASFLSAK